MLFKNVANQFVFFSAFNNNTNSPQTGDASNITVYLSKTNVGDSSPGAFSSLGSPTEVDATNAPGLYYVKLTATNTNADTLTLSAKSTTSGVSLAPQVFYTSSSTVDVNVATISSSTSAAANLANFFTPTAGYHAFNSSIGIGEIVHQGAAQAGGTATITLASNASGSDNFYNGYTVQIISQINNTAAVGQSRRITGYVGSTKVATIDSNWTVQPDTSTVYVVRDDRVRLGPAGLDSARISLVSGGSVSGPATNAKEALGYVYQRLFGKVIKSSTNIIVRNAGDTAAVATQTYTSSGGTDTINAAT